MIPLTTVFLFPYFDLDLDRLGLYVIFGNIMGEILVPKPAKYKSIGVSLDTYKKIVKIAEMERRNISQQLSLMVDNHYEEVRLNTPRNVAQYNGLNSVIDD